VRKEKNIVFGERRGVKWGIKSLSNIEIVLVKMVLSQRKSKVFDLNCASDFHCTLVFAGDSSIRVKTKVVTFVLQ